MGEKSGLENGVAHTSAFVVATLLATFTVGRLAYLRIMLIVDRTNANSALLSVLKHLQTERPRQEILMLAVLRLVISLAEDTLVC